MLFLETGALETAAKNQGRRRKTVASSFFFF
jgi:hypothetical protein